MKQLTGKRNRNKFPCNYCNKTVFEYARHLEDAHAGKKAVAAVLKKPKKQSKKDFEALRQQAIRRHNVEVLETGKGEIIVSRRSVVRSDADDYLPCPSCNMMFSPKQLYRHYRSCNNKQFPTIQKCVRGSVVRQARMIMEVGLTSSKSDTGFIQDVLGTLRRDEICKTVKKDPLILMLGRSLYKRLGKCRSVEIAQRLRLLERMPMAVNKERNPPITLMDCISGKHCDHVLAAVEGLCGAKTDATGRCTFAKPSLGTKLGHLLVKCARLKKREAIKSECKLMEAEADGFLALHQSDWADNISSRALMTLKMNRLKGPEILPQTDDLVKMKHHMTTR
jgi:uncharacterized C2H2 Zn-finger protein